MEEKKKDGSQIGGMFFVGCMFLGAGLGAWLGAGWMIGGAIVMGVGFILMGAIWAYLREK